LMTWFGTGTPILNALQLRRLEDVVDQLTRYVPLQPRPVKGEEKVTGDDIALAGDAHVGFVPLVTACGVTMKMSPNPDKDGPVGPVGPLGPVGPVLPVAPPGEPLGPMGPVLPVGPRVPDAPLAPVGPVAPPGEPLGPMGPVLPVEP
jgi:hypothetical protein